jgi:hypothetical protein
MRGKSEKIERIYFAESSGLRVNESFSEIKLIYQRPYYKDLSD